MNSDELRACALGCNYFVNIKWSCSLAGIRECASKLRVCTSEGLSVAVCVHDVWSIDLGIGRWIRSFEESGYICARCEIRIWLWCSIKGSMVLAVSWTPPFWYQSMVPSVQPW